MIDIKTPQEIAIMAEGGKILASIRDYLLSLAHPGITLLEIDRQAKDRIAASGGVPSFQTVDGYTWATCLCVNDVVVHGIPSAYQLQDGDLLTVDIGLLYKGFHTDTAWTKTIGTKPKAPGQPALHEHFRLTGETAIHKAIQFVKVGNRIGHISQAIQETIESSGYHVVRSLVGHGVGRTLHEEPQIPGYLYRDIATTPQILVGMTLAIEVIYAQGNSAVTYKGNDGWSIATRDGTLSAVYEHTVAVTPRGPQVLTGMGSIQ